MFLCTRPYSGTRLHLPSHRADARKAFCCARRSAILARIIPVIATLRQAGGVTLCGAVP